MSRGRSENLRNAVQIADLPNYRTGMQKPAKCRDTVYTPCRY